MKVESVKVKSYETDLKTIGILQLSAEISLGLRSPVTVKAGEISGGRLGKELENVYAHYARSAQREEDKNEKKPGH